VTGTAEARPRSRLEFVPHSPDLDDGIGAFNRRLSAGGAEFRLQTTGGSPLLAPDGQSVSEERYIAIEGDAVRGGVDLQVQQFSVDGETCLVANMQLPLSEGVVDRRYAHVGMWLIRQVLRRYPRCFALGMGGEDRPLPQLLRAMGFAIWSIPLYFMIANVSRAVRELPALGPPLGRRIASSVVRGTGAGALASGGWRALAAWRTRQVHRVAARPVEEWGAWADQIWEEAHSSFSIVAVRDGRALQALFPTSKSQFPGFRLEEGGCTFGWVVVGVSQMVENAHLGNLKVGTIVDALALPGREAAALGVATRLLLDCGVDVVVTNQSHPAWRAACRRVGFLQARSNYALAASPAFIAPGVDIGAHRVQFTRGDGDGRVHL
jgi:hypothetical protein